MPHYSVRFFIKIMSCFWLCLLLNTQTVKAASVNDPGDALVNKSIPLWMKKNNIPGVAVEVYTKGVPHSYYFGSANLSTKSPVTSKTIFEVGSITKIITTLLLAEQINAGNMKLDNSIATYLPDVNAANKQVGHFTLKMLGSHMTEFPLFPPENVNTREELLKYFSQWKSLSSPGHIWHYSNINIDLLGLSLEAATHKNYQQLCEENVFNRLGMTSSGMAVSQKLAPYLAQGYSENGKPASYSVMQIHPAAGAMKSTGEDMLVLLKASLCVPGTPSEIVNAMHFAQTPYARTPYLFQGLGWVIYPLDVTTKESLLHPPAKSNMGPLAASFVKRQYSDNALVEKTGGTRGFRAYIVFIPKSQSGVVILANRFISDGELIKMGREILFGLTKVT